MGTVAADHRAPGGTSTTGQAASSLPIVPAATASARPMVLTLAVICL